MQYDKSALRFVIETCRRNSYSAKQTYDFINTAWPEAVTLRRVQQIHAELEAGVEKEEDRRGRPRTSRNEENIVKVDSCISVDPCLSLEAIELETGIPATSVRRILIEDLGLQWKLARWLPHKLSDSQKAERVAMCKAMLQMLKKQGAMRRVVVVDEKMVYHFPINTKCVNAGWVHPNDERPVVIRRTQFSAKTMIIAALTFTGKVHVEYVPHGESIDSSGYIHFLQAVFHNFSRHCQPLTSDDILVIHDNARVHVSQAVREFLASRNVTVLKQAPHSPDMNALDRFAFSAVEQKRHNRTFAGGEEVRHHVTDVFRGFSLERLQYEFSELVDDLQSIVNCHGDYL